MKLVMEKQVSAAQFESAHKTAQWENGIRAERINSIQCNHHTGIISL